MTAVNNTRPFPGARIPMNANTIILTCCLLLAANAVRAEDAAPDYGKHVAPILKKYCAGCHNADDKEGGLSLETYAQLQRGGKRGRAILPGQSQASRLLRVLTGEAKPAMPPKGSEAPSAVEIATLKRWIDAGAKGPQGAEPDRAALITPHIAPPKGLHKAVTSLDASPEGRWLAVARFQEVQLFDAKSLQPVRSLGQHPGKVNAVEFSRDGRKLITASGVAGLSGRAAIWNVATGELEREFTGHRDTLYAAALSPQGDVLATAGYDRRIILWDAGSGKQLRTLAGHNGAVYDLAFSPDGAVLASASGDETVKLWQVATGQRLDTLSQPLDEQYVVAFSPDGRFVLAGGVDNRIRVWRLLSRNKPRINPMLYARFAHEGPIVQLAFSPDGRSLVSLAEDRTLKLWETETFTQVHAYPAQPSPSSALAVAADGKSFVIGRLDGSLERYEIRDFAKPVESAVATPVAKAAAAASPASNQTEQEPNDAPNQATPLEAPAIASGVIHAPQGAAAADVDLYRFEAKAGQQWILEINAARSKSPLDSKLEVLDAQGRPILRKVLQAVRDSYITFRGIDSTTRDCRLHNWEEMQLNQFVYMQGEVVKLFLAPRGPDSGFQFYPHDGARRCYFDTSAVSHALQEPCYIVEPREPSAALVPNGLPTFPLYFENDDDGERRLGRDSRLTFTAPADGVYLARVTDVRGYQGPAYKYKLTVRPPRPGFKVSLQGANPTVNAGSGKEFSVTAERIDGFEGEIRVDIADAPRGFGVTTPLVIEAGHTIGAGRSTRCPTPRNLRPKPPRRRASLPRPSWPGNA